MTSFVLPFHDWPRRCRLLRPPLICLVLLCCLTGLLRAQSPTLPTVPAAWWTEADLLNANAANNSGALVIGQLKNTVWSLAKILDTRHTAQGGCGDELRAVVRAWDPNFPATASAASHTPDIVQDGAMLAVANQGQLKHMALLAYRRLKALGMPIVLKDRNGTTQALTERTVDPDTAASLPWSTRQNSAPALVGHLKFCFSFELFVQLPGAGRVVAWGGNASAQSTVPAGLEDAVAVSAGGAHSLALKGNGTVVAWGDNGSGQSTVPAGLSGVVAIAAGASHSLAVRQDGTVVAWGNNQAGQRTVPAGLTGVVAVSAGYFHSLALKSDGTVVAWGAVNYNTDYYYTAHRADYGQATVPAGLTGVVAISAGVYHSLALKSDGTVVAWGTSADPKSYQYSYTSPDTSPPGQYVNRFPDNYDRGQTTVPAGLRAVAISTNYLTSIAVLRDGTLQAWGSSAGSLPTGAAQVVKAAAFQGIEYSGLGYGTVLLHENGTISAWDNAGAAKTDVPAGLTGGRAVSTGGSHALAIVSEQASPGASPPVWVSAAVSFGAEEASITGTYYRAQVMHGPATYSATGLPPGLSINSTTGVVSGSLATAGSYEAVVTATNAAGGQTQNVRFALAHLVPQVLTNTTLQAVIGVPFSQTLSFQQALDDPITASAVVDLPSGLTYDAISRTISGTMTQPGWFAIYVTIQSALGSTTRPLTLGVSNVALWGEDGYPQRDMPAGLSVARSVSLGFRHGMALMNDGFVEAWGNNQYGQIQVPAGLGTVVAIASGNHHNLALKSDGTVAAWGYSYQGQINVPAGLVGVVAIAAGDQRSLALKSDGTVVDWGSGSGNVPVHATGVVSIASGLFHSLALRSDGVVVAWGTNTYGQTTVPAGLTGVVAIAAGKHHSLALKNDGTVVAWGDNTNGQSTVPAGLAGVVAIAGGESHSLALKSDGTVVAWGRNVEGQLNVLAGLTGVKAISARVNSSAAVVSLTPAFASPAWHQMPADPSHTGVYYRSWILGGPATFTATGLPSGLSIDPATGVVTGTATSPSTSIATITATTASGPVSQQVVFRLADLLPQIDNGTGEELRIFQGFSRQLVTRQATGTTVTGLPPGVTYDPDTQVISGTPTQAGTYLATATASNDLGSKNFTITFVVRNTIAWGSNANGRSTLPEELVVGTAIAAGINHGLALDSNQNLVAWGDDGFGKTTVPAGLTDVVGLAAGYYHNLALKNDGTVAAWGISGSRTTVPAGLANVVAISAGTTHSLALRRDRRVIEWGGAASTWGDMMFEVAAISAGGYYSLALKTDGTVRAWGENDHGKATVPSGMVGVVAVAAGPHHALALKGNGTVVAWGRNDAFQSTVPAGLSGVVAIAAGEHHSVALKSDGTVVVWGSMQSVVIPAGLSRVVEIAAGGAFVLARQAPDAKPAFISPARSVGTEDGASATGVYYRASVVNGPATFSASGLPPGLSIDADTGVVSGTPTTPPYSPEVYPPGYPSGYGNEVTVKVTATLTATTSAGTGTKKVDFFYETHTP